MILGKVEFIFVTTLSLFQVSVMIFMISGAKKTKQVLARLLDHILYCLTNNMLYFSDYKSNRSTVENLKKF